MKIENINEMIPVEIITFRLEVLNRIYTPIIQYENKPFNLDENLKEIQVNPYWSCTYIENKSSVVLFYVEWESLEELIWKVWEHIEKHEYSEIYDLTYNFKKYELD